jgi:hypothetical protein
VAGLPFSVTVRATVKLCVLRSKLMGIPGCLIGTPASIAEPAFTVPLAIIGELPVAVPLPAAEAAIAVPLPATDAWAE